MYMTFGVIYRADGIAPLLGRTGFFIEQSTNTCVGNWNENFLVDISIIDL